MLSLFCRVSLKLLWDLVASLFPADDYYCCCCGAWKTCETRFGTSLISVVLQQ